MSVEQLGKYLCRIGEVIIQNPAEAYAQTPPERKASLNRTQTRMMEEGEPCTPVDEIYRGFGQEFVDTGRLLQEYSDFIEKRLGPPPSFISGVVTVDGLTDLKPNFVSVGRYIINVGKKFEEPHEFNRPRTKATNPADSKDNLSRTPGLGKGNYVSEVGGGLFSSGEKNKQFHFYPSSVILSVDPLADLD
jgi:hypothetical protein